MEKLTAPSFPTIVREKGKNLITVEIPDLNVTAKGKNYSDAVGVALETLTSVYIYRTERNMKIIQKHTFESCSELIAKENGTSFVYMLQPVL